mgnify:CR=1 FL=1
MRVQQLSPPQYMPGIKLTRNLSAIEEREIIEETKRQGTLKWGWHAVKDLHINSKNKLERRWYVALFKRKGYMLEGSTLTVGKGKKAHNENDAIVLADLLNSLHAIPAFVKE